VRSFLAQLVVYSLALSAASWLLDGIRLSGGFFEVMLVALVFGVLNALLKPILLLFSLPLLLLTLGLFAFVVNAVVLLLTAALTDALTVSGFGSALLGSLVISFVTLTFGVLLGKEERR